MSVATVARDVWYDAKIFLAEPITGTPTAPGTASTQVNKIWGIFLWVVVIGAVCGLGKAAFAFYSSHQRGEEGAGMKAAGLTICGVVLAFAAPSVIGTITNT